LFLIKKEIFLFNLNVFSSQFELLLYKLIETLLPLCNLL